MEQWLRKVMILPAYGGAFGQTLAQQGAPQTAAPGYLQSAPEQGVADGEMTDAEVKARFRQIVIDKYPEHAAGGVKVVSADEMEKELRS